MVDKLIEALKDWRFYIVFITFLIFIQLCDLETINFIFEKVGAVVGS